jgi:hypothetical protein
MSINRKEFIKTVSKFREIEDARGQLWDRARKLIKKGYELEADILILSTWNFAGFRYFLKSFNIDRFQKILLAIDPLFKKIRHITFKQADFENDIGLQKVIIEIYSKLKAIAKQTGATKIMALRKPNLFIMWDTEIRRMYKIDNKGMPLDYIKFLTKMKVEFRKVAWRSQIIPLAKAIDEYNYVKAAQRRRKKRKS